ncbi:glycerophosphodiester phosphodiesterase family protein [Anaeromyxobacter sp. SG66]|uniref:glycerophosphodiester phosphodiesterase n=2 Tax=Anaeromyxobacteraceae TaxID=1524215 RepID=UPI001F566DC0|nr:glycerophosphodiester phosphodiesterase family protein [Anaeromyxobacter sp. SG66]
MPGAMTDAPRVAGRPLVLGHRGASADAPENTLSAFRLALEQGADGVELDVWRCATGELVVFHDEDAARLTGVALSVPDAPFAALRALDVGALRGDRFRGERIPRLEEVLEALPGAVLNVELKSRLRRADLGLATAVAGVLRRARAGGRVLVSSFDYRLVVAFRVAAPELPVGLLVEAERPRRVLTALATRLLRPAAIHPERQLVTPARARAWAKRGLAVNVWTVDDPEEARRLAALGAAAIITNAPGRIRAALAPRTPSPP